MARLSQPEWSIKYTKKVQTRLSNRRLIGCQVEREKVFNLHNEVVALLLRPL